MRELFIQNSILNGSLLGNRFVFAGPEHGPEPIKQKTETGRMAPDQPPPSNEASDQNVKAMRDLAPQHDSSLDAGMTPEQIAKQKVRADLIRDILKADPNMANALKRMSSMATATQNEEMFTHFLEYVKANIKDPAKVQEAKDAMAKQMTPRKKEGATEAYAQNPVDTGAKQPKLAGGKRIRKTSK